MNIINNTFLLFVTLTFLACDSQFSFIPYSPQPQSCIDSHGNGDTTVPACKAPSNPVKWVSITYPAQRAILADSLLNVSGTFSQGRSVQVTSGVPPYVGSWVTANVNASKVWSATVKLSQGSNQIRAILLDSNGVVYASNQSNYFNSFDTVNVTYQMKNSP